MVPRYSRPEMTAIWSSENRYRIWWQIEVFAAEAMGKELGQTIIVENVNGAGGTLGSGRVATAAPVWQDPRAPWYALAWRARRDAAGPYGGRRASGLGGGRPLLA